MRKRDRTPDPGIDRRPAVVGVALACFAAALAAPLVAVVPVASTAPSVAWPPAGVALALLLVLGFDLWPAVLVGFLGAGVVHSGVDSAAILVAAVATTEACAGTWIVNRWACGAGAVARTRCFVRFAVGGGLIAAALGPALGVPVLTLIGALPPGLEFSPDLVLSWWIGDGVSTLALAPALLLGLRPDPAQVIRSPAEAVALAAALGVSWFMLFTPASSLGAAHYPVEVVAIPPLLWAAYRFGPRVAAVAVLALTIVALAGTHAGAGPFALGTEAASRLVLQAFIAVTAATTIGLATVTSERRTAEAQLTALARTDGLTGLANYRTIIESLQREVSRGMRRGHGFGVLFLDLDRLKDINDTYGHIAGNRAIVRVANAIAVSCRAVDEPARIGGDEFCVLLPDADEPTAWQVVDRITRALAASGGPGALTIRVSAGVAMYPRDGATAEELLGAADVLLYGAKARRAVTPHAPESMRAGATA